jgi:hypothetical protein
MEEKGWIGGWRGGVRVIPAASVFAAARGAAGGGRVAHSEDVSVPRVGRHEVETLTVTGEQERAMSRPPPQIRSLICRATIEIINNNLDCLKQTK